MQFSIFVFNVLLSMYALLIQAAPLHKRETGQATYYNLVGTTSCGDEYADTDLVAALNKPQMGEVANPNKNPNCGKTLTVKGPKGTVKVKVVDTCPGCQRGSLDLSPGAFSKIGSLEAGVIPITWSGL